MFDFPLNRFSFHNYVTARSNKKVTFNLLTSMESSSNMEVVGPEEETVGKQQVVVGVCAMEKKTLSRPMTEILTRLEEFEYIKTYIFSEKVILEEPVERWPVVDCLISFHSKVVSTFLPIIP